MTDFRRTLIAATVAQSLLAVHSEHEDVPCVVVGTPLRVSRGQVLISVLSPGTSGRGTESQIPLESICDVELLGTPNKRVLDVLEEDLKRVLDVLEEDLKLARMTAHLSDDSEPAVGAATLGKGA